MLAAILQYLKNIIGRSKIKVTVFENDLTCLIFFSFLEKWHFLSNFQTLCWMKWHFTDLSNLLLSPGMYYQLAVRMRKI